ncbi:hypothetical protein QBC40DRAFT_253210 [Triangularia verruculosa]|uniref:Uncharacterized protein n=1 Tax=Triangularia verruculosa TaxID=2587418 RepID=A0AAN6XJE5_9PEZI|nr:hypothetical protein QBC40DRAFT_253210 [Triangularia verruculosa]
MGLGKTATALGVAVVSHRLLRQWDEVWRHPGLHLTAGDARVKCPLGQENARAGVQALRRQRSVRLDRTRVPRRWRQHREQRHVQAESRRRTRPRQDGHARPAAAGVLAAGLSVADGLFARRSWPVLVAFTVSAIFGFEQVKCGAIKRGAMMSLLSAGNRDGHTGAACFRDASFKSAKKSEAARRQSTEIPVHRSPSPPKSQSTEVPVHRNPSPPKSQSTEVPVHRSPSPPKSKSTEVQVH